MGGGHERAAAGRAVGAGVQRGADDCGAGAGGAAGAARAERGMVAAVSFPRDEEDAIVHVANAPGQFMAPGGGAKPAL